VPPARYRHPVGISELVGVVLHLFLPQVVLLSAGLWPLTEFLSSMSLRVWFREWITAPDAGPRHSILLWSRDGQLSSDDCVAQVLAATL
jgi:hypothetical protein